MARIARVVPVPDGAWPLSAEAVRRLLHGAGGCAPGAITAEAVWHQHRPADGSLLISVAEVPAGACPSPGWPQPAGQRRPNPGQNPTLPDPRPPSTLLLDYSSAAGGANQRVALAVPSAEDGHLQVRRLAGELMGARRVAHHLSRRRLGIREEQLWEVSTGTASLLVLYIGADDVEAAFTGLACSTDPHDLLWRAILFNGEPRTGRRRLRLPELLIDELAAPAVAWATGPRPSAGARPAAATSH